MAGKIIYERNRTVTLFGRDYNIKVQRFTKKVRQRDPITFKNLGWAEKTFTRGYVAEFPEAHWWPEIDFGDRIVPCSMNGNEERDPAFRKVDQIVEAMVFDAKGWEHEDNESTDDIVARIVKECQ